MKEDLALCKRSLAREGEQNRSLSLQLEATKLLATTPMTIAESSPSASTDSEPSSASAASSRPYPIDSVGVPEFPGELVAGRQIQISLQTMRDKLAEALCSKEKLQQELKLQMSMKAEMEVAMKLLEKDVHEKQGGNGILFKKPEAIFGTLQMQFNSPFEFLYKKSFFSIVNQDTVVSLRGQLEEIKDINLELYTKLQVSPPVVLTCWRHNDRLIISAL